MDFDKALNIVARQLISNVAEDIEWEHIPEIGFYTWEALRKEIAKLTAQPNDAEYDEAIARLEG